MVQLRILLSEKSRGDPILFTEICDLFGKLLIVGDMKVDLGRPELREAARRFASW